MLLDQAINSIVQEEDNHALYNYTNDLLVTT